MRAWSIVPKAAEAEPADREAIHPPTVDRSEASGSYPILRPFVASVAWREAPFTAA